MSRPIYYTAKFRTRGVMVGELIRIASKLGLRLEMSLELEGDPDTYIALTYQGRPFSYRFSTNIWTPETYHPRVFAVPMVNPKSIRDLYMWYMWLEKHGYMFDLESMSLTHPQIEVKYG